MQMNEQQQQQPEREGTSLIDNTHFDIRSQGPMGGATTPNDFSAEFAARQNEQIEAHTFNSAQGSNPYTSNQIMSSATP